MIPAVGSAGKRVTCITLLSQKITCFSDKIEIKEVKKCEESFTHGSLYLKFCQTLTNKYQGIHFCLSIRNSFFFSLDTRGKSPAMMAKKNAIFASLRRNAIRKKAFEIEFIGCNRTNFQTQTYLTLSHSQQGFIRF